MRDCCAQVLDDYNPEAAGAYAHTGGSAALLPIGRHEWQLIQADHASYRPGLLTLTLLSQDEVQQQREWGY